MTYKQPRSVQVVIFAENAGKREYLLLRRRAGDSRFWQPVTGSLEEGESHAQAAVREVYEETGICSTLDELIDLGITNSFEIAHGWRALYAPGVTSNEEICYALEVDKCEVRLDSREHEAYLWADYPTAAGLLYWESNKRAFAATDKLIK